MACEDGPDDVPAVALGHEAGVRIAFEEHANRMFGIVSVLHGEARTSGPQLIYQRIIFNAHGSDGRRRRHPPRQDTP